VYITVKALLVIVENSTVKVCDCSVAFNPPFSFPSGKILFKCLHKRKGSGPATTAKHENDSYVLGLRYTQYFAFCSNGKTEGGGVLPEEP
jgi:hypothetical protein